MSLSINTIINTLSFSIYNQIPFSLPVLFLCLPCFSISAFKTTSFTVTTLRLLFPNLFIYFTIFFVFCSLYEVIFFSLFSAINSTSSLHRSIFSFLNSTFKKKNTSVLFLSVYRIMIKILTGELDFFLQTDRRLRVQLTLAVRTRRSLTQKIGSL